VVDQMRSVLGRLRGVVGPRLSPAMPWMVPFPDGRRRLATRRLLEMFWLWRDIPALWAESRCVYTHYQGGDVVDVGAFHGWYSYLLAAKADGPTTFVSVEPNEAAIPALKLNLDVIGRRFPHIKTVVVEGGVGDGRRLEVAWPAGPNGHPSFRALEDAPADGLTIDTIVEQYALAPGLVKVDVEGAELFALRGMNVTLERHRPIVLLEVHPRWLPVGTTPADVEEVLRVSGYDRTIVETDPGSERQLWLPRA
jgi:FkbM family methyltransferase